MKRVRVIPILLIANRKLVKTQRFKSPQYIGDPINALKVFNEKEVDELVILDIGASRDNRSPDLEYLGILASECFMPISYGGGIVNINQAEDILHVGIEKCILGKAAVENPSLITAMAKTFGSQSVVICLDVSKDMFGRTNAYTLNGTRKVKASVSEFAKAVEGYGAGEIILQTITKDGTLTGYDLEGLAKVTGEVSIPVVAAGGARSIDDFLSAVNHGASAVGAGAMFVFKGPHRAVLINYPSQQELINKLYSKI